MRKYQLGEKSDLTTQNEKMMACVQRATHNINIKLCTS